jgi:ABC-type bacteriocin/lantibiotic exporter with double-glycine peptidase domain
VDSWVDLLGEIGLTSLDDLSSITNIIRIPQIRQVDGYSCAVACLQSVLYFYGKEVDYEFLKKAVKTSPENGTDHRDIIKFVQSIKLPVELRKGMTIFDLQELIDQGKPVILVLQAWSGNGKDPSKGWDSGHYAVGIGYDANNIYLMDPSTLGHYSYIPTGEFITRWHDKDGDIRLVHSGIIISGKQAYNPDQITKLR